MSGATIDTVIVLHAPLAQPWPQRERELLLRLLPYAKRLELERRDAASCTASLAALALLPSALSLLRCDAQPGSLASLLQRLRYEPGGRPTLDGGPGISLGHSAGCVVCAVAADGTVGIDVEDEATAPTLVRLRAHVAREATLKAAGLGLRDRSRVEVCADRARVNAASYVLTDLDLGPNRAAVLASQRLPARLVVESRPAMHPYTCT